MTKTIVLNEEQQKALRFCLGGRRRLQADRQLRKPKG